MKAGYIHIDQTCFVEMNLNPTEAVLYSLVKGYCIHGQKFEVKVDDIAKRVNMTERGVRKVMDRLIERGYLTKERKQLGVEYKLSAEWRSRTEQSSEQERNKVPRRTEQSSEQERNKVPNTPIIINNNNKTYNKEGEGVFYGAILEIFVEHFRSSHGGREYTPNFTTMSTAAHNIIDNIKTCMTGDKYLTDIDTFKAYFSQWIQLAWQKTDDWHRERWSLEFLNSQFTYFNNIINQNGTSTTQSNPNRQQRGGVSDDYIAKQFDKIARSRAARAAGSNDPTAGS